MTTSPTDAQTAVEQQVREFIVGQLGVADLEPDTDLFGAGLVNSLFAVELVAHIESTYGFEVDPEELLPDNFRSVRAVAALVGRRTRRNAQS